MVRRTVKNLTLDIQQKPGNSGHTIPQLAHVASRAAGGSKQEGNGQ